MTEYVCTNAIGADTVPIAIIGAAKNSLAFRLGPFPFPYFINKTARSNDSTLRNWILFVFLPHIRRIITEKVALIVDNASSHCKELQYLRILVLMILLPRKVRSALQPMEMGIILAWKRRSSKLMLREIIREIEKRADLHHAKASM